MFLLASFNGGPPDSVAQLAVAGAILLALGLGLATGRILWGGVLGGFTAALISLILMIVWGGGIGAGGALLLFGIGGGVCGGVGGLASRLIRAWLRRSAPEIEPPPRDRGR